MPTRFGEERIIDISSIKPEKFRKKLIEKHISNKVEESFNKSKQMQLNRFRPSVNGIIINDKPLEIVSPEFDIVTMGRALIGGFSKELPKIMLRKKNNKLPFNTRTQARFNNMYDAAKIESVNNAAEYAIGDIYNNVLNKNQ